MSRSKNKSKGTLYPVLPMRDHVVFPGSTSPFFIGRVKSVEALERSLQSDRQLVVLTQRSPDIEEPGTDDLFNVGTVGKILQVMKLPTNRVKILYKAEQRVKVEGIIDNGKCFVAECVDFPDSSDADDNIGNIVSLIQRELKNYLSKNSKNNELINDLKNPDVSPVSLVNTLVPVLNIDHLIKQEILEMDNMPERLEKIYGMMIQEEENKKLEQKIKERIQKQIGKTHREFYLNEQMKAIQRELGQDDNKADIQEYEKKAKEYKLSAECKTTVDKEIKRLQGLPPYSSEANIIRTYLDWIFALPWNVLTKDELNIFKAEKILNRDHYGLEKVKERILEFIAIGKKVGELKGPIICLVGPPGVGKTSLAKSVAECLGRNFARISLGGVRDEAEIRGHRRTYIGALPGKILQTMKKAKSSNPLILLDEIDKMARGYMGDPGAAMLEVLDREQNNTFMDHYMEIEYDLSKVLFFCTANNAADIPSPLLDRMELIEISGYTEIEKLEIAKRHLVRKQMEENGLEHGEVVYHDKAIMDVIRYYTKESGIRLLERMISKISRKSVRYLEENPSKKSVVITPKRVNEFLGTIKYRYESGNLINEIGLATGLAWTNFGGDMLFIESTFMTGKGTIQLTGKLGDVMKESANTALSYIRSKANSLGIYSSTFKTHDIHIHVPEGATPKDGPSAGVTLTTAMVSMFTGIPVKRYVAMTGEVTLRGKVLPIGGLKEKLLAAKRGDIREVIIPMDNKKDLEDIPAEILESLKIHPVSHVNEVLALALEKMPEAVMDEDEKNHGHSEESSFPLYPKSSDLIESPNP